MSYGMKILVLLWLLRTLRLGGSALAARHCMRIRNSTEHRVVYEWFTALGVGMGLYALSDFLLLFNEIANVPPKIAELYSIWYFMQLLFWQLIQTLGVWTITLVVMDGEAPGRVREVMFWLLCKVRLMKSLKEWECKE